MLKHLIFASMVSAGLWISPSIWAAEADETAAITPEQETQKARGVLRAGQTAEIAAGMSGRLLKVGYKSGQYFKSGALLARFDCARQTAELSALEQAHTTLSVKYDNTNELFMAGAAGELDVKIAGSERDQAAAERDAVQARLKDCSIYAPFPGYVTERHVSAFETPQAGQPIYSVIRAGTTELSIIAPSKWMRWVKRGTTFDFTVDETGETFKAKIIRTAASVDPVSQTIELTARPVGKAKALAGMSGVADFGVK